MRIAQFTQVVWRWVLAFICAAFSVLWLMVLWVNIFGMVRDRDPPDVEKIVVLTGVACAAYVLGRLAYLLARRPNGRPLLSNAFLYGAAVVLAGLAVIGIIAPTPNYAGAMYFFSLSAAAALLAYTRSGKNVA